MPSSLGAGVQVRVVVLLKRYGGAQVARDWVVHAGHCIAQLDEVAVSAEP